MPSATLLGLLCACLLWVAPAEAWSTTLTAPYAGWRPSLSGPVQVTSSEDGFFHVHWTDEGEDAVDPEDSNGNGVPDQVEQVLDVLVDGRAFFEETGWRPLVGDGGQAGQDGIDLYLIALDINGYAVQVDVGEDDAGSCFMAVDPSLSGAVLDSVAIHELHHCVQYRYTRSTHTWVYEASATWEQFRVSDDPALDVAAGWLYMNRIPRPERPLDHVDGLFEYAGFIAIKHWWEVGGDEALLDLWEALSQEPTWTHGLDLATQTSFDLPFEVHFLDFAKYNGFACARDDGAHYDPDLVPCQVETTVPIQEEADGTSFPVVHTHSPYTASYVEVAAVGDPRPLALSCEMLGEEQAGGVRVVALDAEGRAAEEAEAWADEDEALHAALTRAMDPDGAMLAVFASTGTEPLDVSCSTERGELPPPPEEEPPGGCGCRTPTPYPGGPIILLLTALLRRTPPRSGILV